MSDVFNASGYARDLFRQGRSFDAVVKAIEARGRSHNSAFMAARNAQRRPAPRPRTPQGLGSGVEHQFALPAELAAVLKREAAARNVSPYRLASEIMAAVLDDAEGENLVAGVLDEVRE